MYPTPFTPLFNNLGVGQIEMTSPTVVSATTAASAATALPGNPLGMADNTSVCIENTTNGWAFCNFGDANVALATLNNGVGVPPNSYRVVSVQPTTGYVSVILNTGATSGAVRFLRGSGL